IGAGFDPDIWGVNRHARESAEAGLLANRYAEDALRIALTAEVASLYFQVLSLNEQLTAARYGLDTVRRLLAIVELQNREGRLSALELAQQRTLAANTEAAIPPLVQQRQAALGALALLLGRVPANLTVSSVPLATVTVPEVPRGLPSGLLERRPDIRQVEAALMAAHADIGAARAALLPRVAITARAGTAAATFGGLFGPGTGFALAGAELLATIFDGGRLSAQVDLSVARRQELVENYRQTVLSAFRDVEDALAGVEQFTTLQTVREQAREQAQRAYQLAERRYLAGGVDYPTVLEAQRSLIGTEATLSSSRYLRFASLVGLYRALGGGWEGKLNIDS
ncbi:MAG TPA: efflux transporter outer membrane subunit, partial [Rhodocyclaceae bacterium]|nr:efflux transporter outer membrane subunit [Rhodocyclaceae bacterium]